jgi:hypothetical protein
MADLAEIEKLVIEALEKRGFERSPARPGYWIERYTGISYRHRKVMGWAIAAWARGGAETLESKIRGEIDRNLSVRSKP